MAYLLINNCTENYWNRTTTVKIIVGAWVVYFFCNTVQKCVAQPSVSPIGLFVSYARCTDSCSKLCLDYWTY